MDKAQAQLDRGKWASKIQFLFSCIGLCIGLGNIWRFPYLTYENGGAAFLVPYVLLLTVIGRPIYFMELIAGQFTSFGIIKAFRCVPLAQAVPFVMMYAAAIISVYYNAILSYVLAYMYYSFFKVLPWSECDPEWADQFCYTESSGLVPCKKANESLITEFMNDNSTEMDAIPMRNKEGQVVMVPQDNFLAATNGCVNANVSPTEQFFYNRFLRLSSGIEDLGNIQPELFVALLAAWFIVFCIISKGIHSSGKVAIVTSLIPCVILGGFLIRGVSLTGAGAGLSYYLLPDWKRILEYTVWQKATEQVFFSLGVAQGMCTMLGSYNDFPNQLHTDVYIVALVDLSVSFVGGLVVFSVLGNMAHNLQVDVPDVVSSGFGLAFITYPQAVSHLTYPNAWAVAFFAMLFCLAIGSQMAYVETLLTSMKDEFPYLQQRPTMLAAIGCLAGFLFGIPYTTQGGLYILNAFDSEIGGKLLRWIAVLEMAYLAAGYGIERFSLDAEFMMGVPTGWPAKICWKYVCTIGLTVICVASVIQTEPLTLGDYKYPQWVEFTGVALVYIPVLVMVAGGIKHFVNCNMNCSEAVKPSPEWGPKELPNLIRYRLFLFERGIVPPGMTEADHEHVKEAALAMGRDPDPHGHGSAAAGDADNKDPIPPAHHSGGPLLAEGPEHHAAEA
ncbi:sodium- and chloride-dependent glycine transporter 2-like [Haemaphysalis longicornis]